MTGQREATPATAARRVARAATKAALPGAAPLLLSDLSEQARNLKDDDRASLPFAATEGREDPLARGRVTLGLARRARDRLAGAARGRG